MLLLAVAAYATTAFAYLPNVSHDHGTRANATPPATSPAPPAAQPTVASTQPAPPATQPVASTPSPKPRPQPLYGNVRALCVGINQYKSPVALSDLECAEGDAKALADIFEHKYGYQTATLLGKDATRTGITALLDSAIQSSSDNDVLIFFFSGHGATVESESEGREVAYLLPYDVPLTPQNLNQQETYENGAINMRALADRLADPRKVHARHVVMILDCCCSGMAVSSRGVDSLNAEYFQELNQPTRQVITSGRKTEKAYEVSKGDTDFDGTPLPRHGLLTLALLEELQRSDPGAKPVLTMMPDVMDRVFKLGERLCHDRVIPQRKVLYEGEQGGGDFVFALADADWHQSIATQAGSAHAGKGLGKPVDDAEVAQVKTDASATPDQRNSPDAQQRANDLEMRASLGDVKAMQALVFCYHAGVGVPQDDKKAKFWASQGSETGDKQSTAMLADFLSSDASTQLVAAAMRKKNPDLGTVIAVEGVQAIARDPKFQEQVAGFFKGIFTGFQPGDRLASIEHDIAKQPPDWNSVLADLREWNRQIKNAMDSLHTDKEDPRYIELHNLQLSIGTLFEAASFQRKKKMQAELPNAKAILQRVGLIDKKNDQ